MSIKIMRAKNYRGQKHKLKSLLCTSFFICVSGLIAPAAQANNTQTTTPHTVTHKHTVRKHVVRHRPTHQLTMRVDPQIASQHAKTVLMHSPAPQVPTTTHQHLVDFIQRTASAFKYNAYKLGGARFDMQKGVYALDCSEYVDKILQSVFPAAYSNLVRVSGVGKPTSLHYYNFFSNLSEVPQSYWNRVNDVEELRTGDILVFRPKHSYTTTGHVMVVMDKPIRERNMNAFLVRVADSAPFRHSADTRLPHGSGVGIGTMVLKVNPDTGLPLAYAWQVGSPWKHVKIAMARPYVPGNHYASNDSKKYRWNYWM